ncbi:hypothetical protein ACFQJC_11280 [Haloferax namakaokahaiae]|uniref:Twin-arginine translocation signal domain-containing protein n=1 Tax=Haloferax namakaokahaiae TaxID=1748331 RepID=A0ABD5ZGV9_9EURY
MFGFNSSTTGEDEQQKKEKSNGVPRRRFMQAAAGSGALLLGAGTVSANGKGGQAIIHEDEYYPDESFVILEAQECDSPTPYGSCRDDPLFFQCYGQGGRFPPGKGGTLPFPWWNIKYVSGPLEGELLRLYTRDNSIEAGLTYRWTRKEKDCPETPDVFQVGFAPDK